MIQHLEYLAELRIDNEFKDTILFQLVVKFENVTTPNTQSSTIEICII